MHGADSQIFQNTLPDSLVWTNAQVNKLRKSNVFEKKFLETPLIKTRNLRGFLGDLLTKFSTL